MNSLFHIYIYTVITVSVYIDGLIYFWQQSLEKEIL